MVEMQTFWNKEHPLSAKYDELFNQLVPGSGPADTVVGELLRAATKIGYDWYNNGWGCNNWSGAVNYLSEHAEEELGLDAETATKLKTSLDYVYEYSHGEPSFHLDYNGTPCRHVTTITEIVVQGILNTSAVDWTANTGDMYEESEADYTPENDDDEDGEGW